MLKRAPYLVVAMVPTGYPEAYVPATGETVGVFELEVDQSTGRLALGAIERWWPTAKRLAPAGTVFYALPVEACWELKGD